MKHFCALILIVLALASSALCQTPAAKKPAPVKPPVKVSAESTAVAVKPLEAPPSKFGIGIFVGMPIGITIGIDLSRTALLDFKAAWDFSGTAASGVSLLFQGNYQIAVPGVFVLKGNDFVPYFGLGAELAIQADEVKFGCRLPLGLQYRFVKVPLEVFLEAGVGMYLYPGTGLLLGGGGGIRYRFW